MAIVPGTREKVGGDDMLQSQHTIESPVMSNRARNEIAEHLGTLHNTRQIRMFWKGRCELMWQNIYGPRMLPGCFSSLLMSHVYNVLCTSCDAQVSSVLPSEKPRIV